MIAAWVKYRITTVMKVETDIITNITVSLIGRAVLLVIMYVEIFKTDVIIFIGNVIMCLTSHWLMIFCIWSRFVDTGHISLRSKEKCVNYWSFYLFVFQHWLSDIEIFATIIAALIHDYEHTETTNNFHIMTGWVTMLHITQELQITFTWQGEL